MRINSPLDEYLAGVTDNRINEKYTAVDYPKAYSKELILKFNIRNIDFQAITKKINNKTISSNLEDESNLPSLKFSYNYNRNGDLVLYEEYRLYPEKGITERISQLTKTYDNSGQLIAWRWIAPPIDSSKHYHFDALFTPVQEQYGPYQKRGWVQRDENGREVATIYVSVEPKPDERTFEKQSLFKGSQTFYSIRKSQYNSKDQLLLESASGSLTDSAAIFTDKKPIYFTTYHYDRNGRLNKKISTSVFQAFDGFSSWLIMLIDFAPIGKQRVTKTETYKKRYESKSPSGIYELLERGHELVPKYWGESLITQIPGETEKNKTESFNYTSAGKLKTYKSKSEEPDLIITRSYRGKWVIEKAFESNLQFWLIRRFKNNLLTHEFFAQGYTSIVSPKVFLFFFPRGREKREMFYGGNNVSLITFNYQEYRLNLVTNDNCRGRNFTPSHNRPFPPIDFPKETCFSPFKNLLQLGRYETLFLKNKKYEAGFLESKGKRQQLFNFSYTTY